MNFSLETQSLPVLLSNSPDLDGKINKPMPRYKLTIEYDGTPFNGWQRQRDQPSVQQAIEDAVFKFSGDVVSVVGAGRTDTGVHATGQVAHLDLTKEWAADRVRQAVNFHLRPQPVVIRDVEHVDDDFSARFSASARHYRYHIVNRHTPLALKIGRAWHVKRPLDVEVMHKAAQQLVGTFDFTTFRHVHCQAKSPVKTLDQLDVVRHDDDVIIETSARSYLHNQVRSFVGSLVQVGIGKWSEADLKNALVACDRQRCGPVAPANGLYLCKVDY